MMRLSLRAVALVAAIVAVDLVCVVPFFLSGLVIALLMAHRAERANRLYFFDLFGAAFGCLAFIPFTNLLGAPTAVLIGSVAGAASELGCRVNSSASATPTA